MSTKADYWNRVVKILQAIVNDPTVTEQMAQEASREMKKAKTNVKQH